MQNLKNTTHAKNTAPLNNTTDKAHDNKQGFQTQSTGRSVLIRIVKVLVLASIAWGIYFLLVTSGFLPRSADAIDQSISTAIKFTNTSQDQSSNLPKPNPQTNNILTNHSQTNNTQTNNTQTPSHDRQIEASPLTLAEATIDRVYVDKSTQKMYLMQEGKAVKSYHIALGDAPKGHKQQEGDERTPEGVYTLDWTNENSIAYRSIHISYPNEADIASAKARGVSPGGAIMIHGQMNGTGQFAKLTQQRNWTDGCIAVTDDEMDEIMSAVKVGTPIEIVW